MNLNPRILASFSSPSARAAAAAFVAAALLLSSQTAGANSMAQPPQTTEFGAPEGKNTVLEIEREELSFRCDADGDRPFCDVEAVYFVHNPTDAEQSTVASFVGFLTTRVEVTLDGEAVEPAEPKPKLAAVEPPHVVEVTGARPDYEELRAKWTKQWPYRVSVAPRETARMQIRGRMYPATTGPDWSSIYVMSPSRTRHPLLGTDAAATPHYRFRYLLSPIRTWSGDPDIAISVEHPEHWDVDLGLSGSNAPAVWRAAKEGRGSVKVSQVTVSAADVDELRIETRIPYREVRQGGVFLGFGGNLDDADNWRLAAGYELAVGDWLFPSIAVESDLDEHLVVTPLVTAAGGSGMFVIPSFGIGAGPTFQVTPAFNPGARVELSAIWPVIGGPTFYFDYFPTLASDDPLARQVGFLWRVGL